MRKSLIIAILFLILPAIAKAQNQIILSQTVSATGTFGTTGNVSGLNIGVNHLVWTPTGSPSSCTIAVDSSTNGTTWSSGGIISSQTCTSGGSTTVYNTQPTYLRVNLSALSGGSSPTLSFTYTGSSNTLYSGPAYLQLYSASITPAATSAAIQTVAQTFTFTGLNSGDQVFLVSQPAATSLCPATSARATAANTLSVYFTVLTAAACTPTSGTYTVGAVR